MNQPDQPERPEPSTEGTEHTVEHRAERTYRVPASPEEVWEAIATAGGMSSWMMMPTRLDPRVGGEVAFVMDDFTSAGVVTDYRPNTRFAFEEPWPIAERVEDVPAGMLTWFESIGVSMTEVHEGLSAVTPIATEFLVEAESGGSCVLRVVTSAYGPGADWENEFFEQMVASLEPMWEALAARLGTAVRS